MRVIAVVMLLAMTVQIPMALHSSAATETPEIKTEATVMAENSTALSGLTETEVNTVKTEEPKNETTEEIIYKEIVEAEPIDTSKPLLQEVHASPTDDGFRGMAYNLTDYERDLVERVVMSEIRGGPYNDKLAVAQCIYDRVVNYGWSVEDVLFQRNAFADPYGGSTYQSVKDAVSEVFDEGKRVTKEPIYYFIATYAVKPGCFHETQKCILVTDEHRYYTKW